MIHSLVNFIYDLFFGIETREFVPNEILNLNESDAIKATHYEGSSYLALREIFRHFPVKGKSLVDVGSGKGRVLFYTHYKGASHSVGIEFSSLLKKAYLRNLRNFHFNNDNIELFFEDAIQFQSFKDFDYIFLFNPLTETYLEQFLNHLSSTMNPRAKIISLNPVFTSLYIEAGFSREQVIKIPFSLEVAHIYQIP